jgi:hypothetical protein
VLQWLSNAGAVPRDGWWILLQQRPQVPDIDKAEHLPLCPPTRDKLVTAPRIPGADRQLSRVGGQKDNWSGE